MKITDIKPNPNNPRIIKDDKFQKLVKSIQEFPEMMAKRPIVCVTDVDGKLYPLGGNMRLKAIQELKYKTIPDEWITLADDWTKEQRSEFVIKDNIGYGEWDWDDLANNWDAEELTEWGLDVWNNNLNDELLSIDNTIDEVKDSSPKITDEGYSLFEIVMLHENKLILLDVINQLKREFLFEKTEEAIMELIRIYQNKK